MQPQPGSAFYFSHDEAFSKPGASLRLYVQPSRTPDDDLEAGSDKAGRPRRQLGVLERPGVGLACWTATRADPADFRGHGTFELSVPDDIAPTTVADQEALWMRVRLVSGGYGSIRTVSVDTTELTFFVPQPPSLTDLRLGYAWQDGPFPPERVLAYNDFRYEDRTVEATWPGKTFQPFVPVGDSTPGCTWASTARCPSTTSASSSTSSRSAGRPRARRSCGSTGTASAGSGWPWRTRPAASASRESCR